MFMKASRVSGSTVTITGLNECSFCCTDRVGRDFANPRSFCKVPCDARLWSASQRKVVLCPIPYSFCQRNGSVTRMTSGRVEVCADDPPEDVLLLSPKRVKSCVRKYEGAQEGADKSGRVVGLGAGVV